METLLDQILASPRLSLYHRRIGEKLRDEARRRTDFYAQITEDDKAEFINGEPVMNSPVRYEHNVVSSLLFRLIQIHADLRRLGAAGHEKLMISLTRNDYEPDVCFFNASKAAAFAPGQLRFPAPDFIAEVISESTEALDRGVKFEDYAAHGVTEYWIVDPDRQSVEQYLLNGDAYTRVPEPADGFLSSVAIPGFRIPLRSIFDAEANLMALRDLMSAAPPPGHTG